MLSDKETKSVMKEILAGKDLDEVSLVGLCTLAKEFLKKQWHDRSSAVTGEINDEKNNSNTGFFGRCIDGRGT